MGDGGVLYMSPHGWEKQASTNTDQGGRRRRRGAGYIRGVFSAGNEVGDGTSIRMIGKGKQPRETQITLHVLELEG